jgi:mannose-6-phosphate isomerase-like protein (cupin superfamily)
MFIRSFQKLTEFTAGDGSILREFFNPVKDSELSGVSYSLAHAAVNPETITKRHTLTHSEVYYILRGRGIMHIDSETREVEETDAIYIPPGSEQYIECISERPLEFLCIVDPAWTPSCEKIIG